MMKISAARLPAQRRHKYGAKKTEVDGIVFASKAEAKRYAELKLLERAKLIRDLKVQPRFPLVVNEVLVCTYVADFSYVLPDTEKTVVEDVKSKATITDVYRVKVKLLAALHGITVTEVMKP